MEKKFRSGFCDVEISGVLTAPSDMLDVNEACEVAERTVQVGFESIHELAIRTNIGSMYPTGELIFRTSDVDTMSKLMLEQIVCINLTFQVRYNNKDGIVEDKDYMGTYIVSRITENEELKKTCGNKSGTDRFYNISFDSERKLQLFGQCLYSTFKGDETEKPISDIVESIFGDVGIELNLDYFTDDTECRYITANNTTVRSAFQYLMRRSFDVNKGCTDIDIPLLLYDAFGDNYRLVSMRKLKDMMNDRHEEEITASRNDTWTFNLQAGTDTCSEKDEYNIVKHSFVNGSMNMNDIIRDYYNWLRVDYDPEFDTITDGEEVEIDTLVQGIPLTDIPEDTSQGSGYKMPTVEKFLGTFYKKFGRNAGKAPLFTSSTFRDNLFMDRFIKDLLFKSDRLKIDAPGNLYRTVGDIATVGAPENAINDYNITKLYGTYIIGDVTHRFVKTNDGKFIFRDEVQLLTTASKGSDLKLV